MDLSLEAATAGLGEGELRMDLITRTGTITIALDERGAPKAVAHVVSLARGLRPFVDVKTSEVVKRPFYDGLRVFRGEVGYWIQSGCPRGDGRGGPGFTRAFPKNSTLRHDRSGVISLVDVGQGRYGSQFLITDAPMPMLDAQALPIGRIIEGQAVMSRLIKAASLKESVTLDAISVYRQRESKHAAENKPTKPQGSSSGKEAASGQDATASPAS